MLVARSNNRYEATTGTACEFCPRKGRELDQEWSRQERSFSCSCILFVCWSRLTSKHIILVLICFSEIDYCTSGPQPCLNNGICQPRFGSFICQCQPGYTGDRCQSGKWKRERLGREFGCCLQAGEEKTLLTERKAQCSTLLGLGMWCVCMCVKMIC